MEHTLYSNLFTYSRSITTRPEPSYIENGIKRAQIAHHPIWFAFLKTVVAIRKPPRDPSPRRGAAVPLRFTKQRERILDVATPLLNAKGVCGMTLHEVAAALGLQTSSVTYYYRYKEQLAAAVIEDSLLRLGTLARTAAAAASPRLRVAAFIDLYFDQHARALRGEVRPLAVLSEIRTFDSAVRGQLIAEYQSVFRTVRSFFGEWSSEAEKNLFTVRAQVLNESLFWTAMWLGRHSISEFPAVARRMFDILERGLLTTPSPLPAAIVEPESESETAGSLQHSAFLRVATRLINEIGYKGASIDRISSELNVTRGSFYHHIDTKSDLVLDCSRETYRRLRGLHAASVAAHGEGWSSISSAISTAVSLQLYGDSPFLRATALQAIPGELRALAIELASRHSLWLSGVLVEAMQRGVVRVVDPLIASHFIISTIDSACDMRSWARRQSKEKSVDMYASTLFQGLFADPAER